MYQFRSTGEFPAIVHLALQYSPEALHGPIVNAVGYARHALSHFLFDESIAKAEARILKSAIAVKQWMCGWFCFYCCIERIKRQPVIIMVAYYKRHNSAIIEIQYGT